MIWLSAKCKYTNNKSNAYNNVCMLCKCYIHVLTIPFLSEERVFLSVLALRCGCINTKLLEIWFCLFLMAEQCQMSNFFVSCSIWVLSINRKRLTCCSEHRAIVCDWKYVQRKGFKSLSWQMFVFATQTIHDKSRARIFDQDKRNYWRCVVIREMQKIGEIYLLLCVI